MSAQTYNKAKDRTLKAVITAFTLTIFLSILEFGTEAADISNYILPRPSEIWGELSFLIQSPIFWDNFRITATEALAGFVIGSSVALFLGTLISQFKIAEIILMPYIVGLQSIPKIALAPLFLIWFGFGISSKIAVAAVVVFFPMLINTIEGLRSADADLVEMPKAFGANKRQIFFRIKVPNALPFIFAGLDIAIVFSVLGAIVGEFLGAKGGLGAMLLQANYNFNIAQLFAILIFLSLSGLTLHSIVKFLNKKVVFWKQTDINVIGV
jgi:NitT/TauT family transport system permease protein